MGERTDGQCADAAGVKPPPRGFEPLTESAEVSPNTHVTDSQETCLPTGLPKSAQFRADLGRLIEAWPRLSESVRAAILLLADPPSPDCADVSSRTSPATGLDAVPRRASGATLSQGGEK